jgi:lysophospholipase L1-like esterase
MSVLTRVRTRLLVCVAAIATLGALVVAPTAGAAKLGNTYLALGDSLTYGYHQAQFKSEYPNINPANYSDGYATDFANILKIANRNLTFINDGCPGETSETFINGSGIPGYCAGGPTGTPFPQVWLHHPYAEGGSQLADALSVLKANPNVSPISLDIGANDVLQFLEHTCGFPATYTCTEEQVAAEYGHIAGNVYNILSQLRAAAPNAQIVVIGNYNPYPTILPAPGGDKSLALLNGALSAATAKVKGTSFTSVEPLFNGPGFFGGSTAEAGDIPTICSFTAMCPGGTFNPASPEADIHPTKLGYGVMAADVTLDYLLH